MNIETIVKEIHKSDILGTFIEVGAGQPVAHELFNINGASKTVYKAESPYNKSHQQSKYGTVKRAVSKEFCERIIRKEKQEGFMDRNHNTYFVSSFQIADKPDMLTHGWIGLHYRGVEQYYHLTLTNCNEERSKTISLIGAIGIRILSCKNNLGELRELLNKESAMYSCIDIIESEIGVPFLDAVISNLESGLEHPITISKEGRLIRLEDLSRKGELMLMKGSFNPLHNHHLELIKQAEKLYPSAIPCFVISLDTYSKDKLIIEHLILRIEMLNKLGYPVIVFRTGLFSQNVYYLRKHRFVKNKIIFPLGTDTVNRLIKVSYNNFSKPENVLAFKSHFENVEFLMFDRTCDEAIPSQVELVSHFKDITTDESTESSTVIRTLFEEENYEEIRKYVPKEIYDEVIVYLAKVLTIKS